MAHVRKGRRAKQRRQERADTQKLVTRQFLEMYENLDPAERHLMAIFGAHEKCEDCSNEKLIGTDCQTPNCKTLRQESSVYYDEIAEDHVTVRGATMHAGIDY